MTNVATKLNSLSPSARREALARCCQAPAWVDAVAAAAPYRDAEEVMTAARSAAGLLDRDGWLEAFAAHPRIGDVESLRAKFAGTKAWATGEQRGVAGASEATLERLAQKNAEYLVKFGYQFIVCATGKTADEMLTMLEERLGNGPADELPIASAEQLKITLLRLEKLAE
ncbi:MAG: 2-oxo-4-hydroxy-4-carboxy-5-ureidoimidazoline decarboxylase [Planctomycetota bacterium]